MLKLLSPSNPTRSENNKKLRHELNAKIL